MLYVRVTQGQGWRRKLWALQLLQFQGPFLKKKNTDFKKYKIGFKAFVQVSWVLSFSFINFTVKPPLLRELVKNLKKKRETSLVVQ